MYNGPQRKYLRLKNYNYSQVGYYFITICCYKKQSFFGEISDGKMCLNEYGRIAEKVLLELPQHYINCKIDEYIFMPNHFHGIIEITNDNNMMECLQDNAMKCLQNIVGTGLKPVPTEKRQTKANKLGKKVHGLSEMMRGFKTFSSRKINNFQKDFTFSWQRSFFDKIIRNEDQLLKTRQYIINNPRKWDLDMNNPENEERVRELRKQKRM